MTKDTLYRLLKQNYVKMDKFGIKRIGFFGSVARNEATTGSDVDMLVEFSGPATFDRYMDLKMFLEQMLGAHVDLVTQKALKPRLREVIEKETIYVT